MTKKTVPHPIQPLEMVNDVIRFKRNNIVNFLLDFGQKHHMGLNELHRMDFSQEDWEQFAQLIGYSHSGASDLSYMSDKTLSIAWTIWERGTDLKDAAISVLEAKLTNIKKAFRSIAGDLFENDEDIRWG